MPSSTNFLQPIACNKFVALWKRVNAIPYPMFRSHLLGSIIKNILRLNMDCIKIFCQLRNYHAQFISGSTTT